VITASHFSMQLEFYNTILGMVSRHYTTLNTSLCSYYMHRKTRDNIIL
jgi:hypothetical protein